MTKELLAALDAHEAHLESLLSNTLIPSDPDERAIRLQLQATRDFRKTQPAEVEVPSESGWTLRARLKHFFTKDVRESLVVPIAVGNLVAALVGVGFALTLLHWGDIGAYSSYILLSAALIAISGVMFVRRRPGAKFNSLMLLVPISLGVSALAGVLSSVWVFAAPLAGLFLIISTVVVARAER